MTDNTPLVADGKWMRATSRLLGVIFQNGVEGKSIVDLGCLEGGYALEFARMGMFAKGIEVRQSNYASCIYLKNKTRLQNLTFELDDVANLGDHGSFDVVFCCGVLYHVDRPVQLIEKMSLAANTAIIVNTHFAPDEESKVFNLSPLEINEGYPGRWYAEHDSDDQLEIESYKLSSWKNKRSFWLTRASILQNIMNGGFDMVFEQADFQGEDIMQAMTNGDYGALHRSTFVGIKTKALA